MNTDRHRFLTITNCELQIANLLYFLCVLCILFSSASAQTQPKMSSRILLIPLDDRPPCLQFPVRMGLIGDAEIVTPPRELLGRFTEFGKSDAIIEWLKKQNLKSFDAAIVSVDMLAYGGLVAMRVHQTDDTTAMRRLAFVREMRRLAPRMKIYGSSVIMRLAPTGTGDNEAYREKLARWAETSVELDEKSKNETAKLEREIPAFALADYKAARLRDLKINQASINLVKDKIFDYLILSQDDAKPRGIHVADREKLITETARLNLTEQVAVQPGADEVSMLLLARSLMDKYNYHPKIKAIYSSEELSTKAMPYEDRALNQTVSFHIKAVGGIETQVEKDADILFYVFASRFETGKADKFAQEIYNRFYDIPADCRGTLKSLCMPRKPFIVADVDPKGDIQGADVRFTEQLKSKALFAIISGYASWNTAGNTIGTALPHGVLSNLSAHLLRSNPKNVSKARGREIYQFSTRVEQAQTWFLLNRLLDDYVYHSLVRPEAMKFAREKGWNVFRFNDEQTNAVEEFSSPRVKEKISQNLNSINTASSSTMVCDELKTFDFKLPWGRTFEAEIDFDLVCTQITTDTIRNANLKK